MLSHNRITHLIQLVRRLIRRECLQPIQARAPISAMQPKHLASRDDVVALVYSSPQFKNLGHNCPLARSYTSARIVSCIVIAKGVYAGSDGWNHYITRQLQCIWVRSCVTHLCYAPSEINIRMSDSTKTLRSKNIVTSTIQENAHVLHETYGSAICG